MNGKLSLRIVLQFRKRFESDCIEGILTGYAKMRLDSQYQTDWIEDKLTAHLVAKMHETGFFADKDITISPQAPLYDDGVVYGDGDPCKSPRIDFKFGRNWNRKEYNYYAEAKNLSAANWTKPNGASVGAYDSRAYYISDGINRYLTNYYPEGCLIGYIVNGKVPGVVSTLNRLIIRRGASPKIGFIERDISSNSDCCYISQNQVQDRIYPLRHLLLQLA